jgi:osmoprotectant transport system substrate-binding protein
MEENSLVWLDYAPFNNTYTLMMQRQAQEERGITEISDLQGYFEENPDAKVCIDQEFAVRPDGLPALQEDYGLNISDQNVIPMEIGVTYKALRDEQCQVSMGFATDGRISAWSFFNLEDDQSFFPVYNPSPVVRQEIVDQCPGIRDVLNPIANALDTETMTRLNALVDVGPDEELDTGDEREPQPVAQEYLQEQGFIDGSN